MPKFTLTFNSEAENLDDLLKNIEVAKVAVETAKKCYPSEDFLKEHNNLINSFWENKSTMPSNLTVKYAEK